MAELRKCIGSAKFGIAAHEAPVADFPAQPSQKEGLGRMCRLHWNRYTAGLARDAKARKAAAGATDAPLQEAEAAPAVAATSGSEIVDHGRDDGRRGAADLMTDALATSRVKAARRRRNEVTPAAGSQGDAG